MPRPTESLTKPAGVPSGTPAGSASADDITAGDEIDEPSQSDVAPDPEPPEPTPPAPSPAPSSPLPDPPSPDSDLPVVTHRVSRAFSGGGLQRHPGELIDASAWRFNKSLEAMRYIAPVNHYEPPEVFFSPDGRMWDDSKLAVAHATSPTTT